jgi:hypothetical protein
MSVNHCYACSTALMAVKTCSKALLAPNRRHGKSPCFLEVAFLRSVGPDYRLSVLPSVDGQENMECAF